MKWLQAFWKSLTGDAQREKQEKGGRREGHTPEDEERSCPEPEEGFTSPPAVGRGAATSATGKPRQPRAEKAQSRSIRAKENVPQRVAVIQVGIDFGTSTTKIAYRQVNPRGQVRPLIFDHGLEGVPAFGLPTLAMVDSDGRLLVGEEAATRMMDRSWDEALRAFKVLVASRVDSSLDARELSEAFDRYARQHPINGRVLTPETMSFIYIAYAMRVARHRISELPEYADSRIEFLYNVCIPMQHVESNPALDAFRQILAKAEAVERDWPYDSGTEWLAGNYSLYETGRLGSPERTFVIPESVAEAASYFLSLRRSPGLHALIDIGAGTTDVSFFNLIGEHCYWYSSGNLPIGGLAIEQLVGMNGGDTLTAGQVSERINGLRRGTEPDLVRGVKQVLWRIHEAAQPVWSAAYKHLHKEMPWHRVEVFLSGGGAEVVGAEETFRSPWWQHLTQKHIRYPVAALPEPDDYDSVDGRGPFSRMAVAYGLTYPEPELGDYTMPGDCPDHTPPPLPIRPPDPTAPWV